MPAKVAIQKTLHVPSLMRRQLLPRWAVCNGRSASQGDGAGQANDLLGLLVVVSCHTSPMRLDHLCAKNPAFLMALAVQAVLQLLMTFKLLLANDSVLIGLRFPALLSPVGGTDATGLSATLELNHGIG